MGRISHTDYRITCSVIETELLRRYPYAVSQKDSLDEINHLLWVIRSIQGLNDQREVNLRVNWIIARANSMRLLDQSDREHREEYALVNLDISRAH